MLRFIRSAGVLLFVVLLAGCTAGGRVGDRAENRAGGVVAADHVLASDAGVEVLRAGGNAVDAAVASCLALSVVRPDSCGIGGGGFMLIHLEDAPEGEPADVALDFRETCPAGIGPDTYAQWNDPEASRVGGRAVGVPGTVAGLIEAQARYGVLDRGAVFAPAIRLAEEGFPADAHHVETAREVAARFGEHPGWAARFGFVWDTMTHGGAIREGDIIRNPGQGWALRLIAERGASAFYDGPIAGAIVDAVARDGGVLTRADLSGYSVRWAEPIRVRWRGKELLLMPPPSSGGVAIGQMFLLADRVGLSMPAEGWPDVTNAHLLAEIFKHAFADRSRLLADPAFHRNPIGEMLDPATLDRTAGLIDPGQTRPTGDYGVASLPEDAGTSHLSVVDGRGNAVACTQTINLAFGSLLGVPGYGFCLNNEMDDFTTVRGEANAFGLRQSEANLPHPGQRPLSSMSPTIVLDGDGVYAVTGASGGPRIITSTAQVLMRVLLGDASAGRAVGGPRLHHQWLPDRLDLETWGGGPPGFLVEGLADRGHTIGRRRVVGAVQLILRGADGRCQAASDPRKGGAPAWE